MRIDLTNILANIVSAININEQVIIDDEMLKTSNIRRLDNTMFKGRIFKDYEDNLVLEGNITGTMVLPDDITLKDVNYEFKSEIFEYIEEVFTIDKNSIDILDYLWQNILVEVPLKVRSDEDDNITLKGDGWRFITEEELNNRSNRPFSDLSKLLDK